MDIKDVLKKLRGTTGLSQKDFANKFSIPVSTYEHWEMGVRKPPVYVVNLIETVLNYEQLLKMGS